MKIYLLTFIATFFLCANIVAQKNKEKIKALKISFLTQELNLSSKEAQKFWPIYNEHEKNLENLRNEGGLEIRKKIKITGGVDAITEEEAKKFVTSKLNLDKKVLVEKENFLLKITTVLPYKKILKLQLSQRNFARRLMRKYREEYRK